MSSKKIKYEIEYDIQFASVGDGSATGYICKTIGYDEIAKVDFNDIRLTIYNMTTCSNLQMLKAFVEDLIYLESMGVQILLFNS